MRFNDGISRAFLILYSDVECSIETAEKEVCHSDIFILLFLRQVHWHTIAGFRSSLETIDSVRQKLVWFIESSLTISHA